MFVRNPLTFTPLPVTLIVVATYVSLFTGLLYVHHVVPSDPTHDKPLVGINTTEAWLDLQELTNGYHPYNSRRNDQVREWLVKRINDILERNGVSYSTEHLCLRHCSISSSVNSKQKEDPAVLVFNDMVSDATFSSGSGVESVYFEGTNIMVYVRGSEDVQHAKGVLVNAHYDSVSTGYGATDDGVGVVTVLQLINFFTTPGHRPKRGLVALLNNGEEDYLNGARAFMSHPISSFPDTFLNLEGAGAGGRAALFRSTDYEVTKYYRGSPHPFGNVLSADAFNRRLIRSQTDYLVFNENLGLRGLDVAFFVARARYHTLEDASRTTSRASLWHMLSTALATTRGLTSDISSKFDPGSGSNAVWFDMFGRVFGLLSLHIMFAISVALLTITPIVLLVVLIMLNKQDKWYLGATRAQSSLLDSSDPDDDTAIQLRGWHGVFRFPIAFIFASASVIGLAILLTKVNPYIIYSSQYAVWSMMLCAWFVVIWSSLWLADLVRPSAFHRAYSFGWIFIILWLLLVVVTVAENKLKIAGGYFVVIYFGAVFAALVVACLEMFSLPRKSDYVRSVRNTEDMSRTTQITQRPSSRNFDGDPDADPVERNEISATQNNPDLGATETTSLLPSGPRSAWNRYKNIQARWKPTSVPGNGIYDITSVEASLGREQAWSSGLPTWGWPIQFLIVAPISVILVGQVGLLLTSALHQTPADGNSVSLIYLSIAALSTLLLMPIAPFIHRFHFQIPVFLSLVFVGTIVYNLTAFPFSEQNRLKVRFLQSVDLESGINQVSLTGLDGYIQKIVASIPSAAGQQIECQHSLIPGLQSCAWHGPAPNVVPSHTSDSLLETYDQLRPEERYLSWLNFNVTRSNHTKNGATINVVGGNTRACVLQFNRPIVDFNVEGAAPHDERLLKTPKGGAKEIRLWSREWEKPWSVHVQWEGETNSTSVNGQEQGRLDGRVIALWSDQNENGAIPALEEVKRFMPTWAIVTKLGDGLVEGSKAFTL